MAVPKSIIGIIISTMWTSLDMSKVVSKQSIRTFLIICTYKMMI